MATPLQGTWHQRGPVCVSLTPSILLKLTKMELQDNPEAFLLIFKRVAAVANWPVENWPTPLALCLMGTAQLYIKASAWQLHKITLS